MKNEISTGLEELDQKISYEDLNVNILFNRFSLEKVQTRQDNLSISAKNVKIQGVSYSQVLFNNEIEINKLLIDEPQIIQFPADTSESKKLSDRSIKIDEIQIVNGSFSKKENDSAEVSIYLRFPKIKIKPQNAEFEHLKPQSYELHLDSVYTKMNAEHYIDVDDIKAENGSVDISHFKIIPFDPKEVFDQKIPYEKDRISLEIKSITLDSLAFEAQNDTLHFRDSKMQISEAFLEIYRNKLIRDDPRKKPLYNELLRELPVKMHFEKILVISSEIIYEEQVKEGREAAVIRFSGLEGEIENLHNLKGELPQPQVNARAHFMRGTPVSMTWTFPVFDPANNFAVSGNFGSLEGEALDPFLIPAMDIQTRGEINGINFNFSGHENVMDGDFEMDYKELEVQILKNDGTEKRSIVSAIANLFVENEGDTGGENERIEVERDKQRSFWNYLWLGLRKGFLEVAGQL